MSAAVVPIIDEEKIRLTPLTVDQAEAYWPHILPHLMPVFEYSCGRVDADATYDAVMEGMAELLLVWNPDTALIFAVIVGEGRNYPGRKVYSVGLCAGHHLDIWAERVWKGLKKHAVDSGFNQIEVVGRRGWKRFIPGAEEIATFYAMDLDREEAT